MFFSFILFLFSLAPGEAGGHHGIFGGSSRRGEICQASEDSSWMCLFSAWTTGTQHQQLLAHTHTLGGELKKFLNMHTHYMAPQEICRHTSNTHSGDRHYTAHRSYETLVDVLAGPESVSRETGVSCFPVIPLLLTDTPLVWRLAFLPQVV